ncbi:MAG: hypothetical protein JWN04_6418 [Myxococcaceae bacterium]|nr:hypothetical protein [Myxococcaceae bacterium]
MTAKDQELFCSMLVVISKRTAHRLSERTRSHAARRFLVGRVIAACHPRGQGGAQRSSASGPAVVPGARTIGARRQRLREAGARRAEIRLWVPAGVPALLHERPVGSAKPG